MPASLGRCTGAAPADTAEGNPEPSTMCRRDLPWLHILTVLPHSRAGPCTSTSAMLQIATEDNNTLREGKNGGRGNTEKRLLTLSQGGARSGSATWRSGHGG